MFQIIAKIFIVVLSGIVNALTILNVFMHLSNQKCEIQPTLTN